MLSHFLQYLTQYQFQLAFYLVGAAFLVALFTRRLPSVDSVQAIATMLNTRGGNILLLGGFSWFFFVQAMRLFYNLLDMIRAGQLTPDNAFALMALQFVTSVAFGGAFGAMLKTMTGDNPIPPGGGSSTITQSISTTPSAPNPQSSPPPAPSPAPAPTPAP